LIQDDPARAEEAVVSLADLYRKLTALARRETVPLEAERGLVQDYLAVEHMRLGRLLRVHWDWPEELAHREVPPLLVQPLVENAIKHGLAPHKGGGELRITAAAEGAGLRFSVADDGIPLDPAWKPGTGLSNLEARLAILGRGSRLQLRQAEGWTLAELWLWPGGAP
jgi:LytS/YehU family sensor histidine kinase